MKKLSLLLMVLAVSLGIYAQSNGFKWVREIHYPMVHSYSEGKAAFMENGKWGFLDKDGNVVIQAIYDSVRDYEGGFAIVKQDGNWGVIDKDGNYVFEPVYVYMSDFDSGIALAKGEGQSYFLYTNGKKVTLSPKYDYYPYSDGFARIREKDKWGYINVKGNVAIDPKFSEASDFTEGYAFVTRKDEMYYINTKGSKRNMTYLPDSIIVFKEGLGRANSKNIISFMRAEDLTYLPYRFKKAADFSEGLASVTFSDDTKGYIGKQGSRVISLPSDSEPGNFSGGLAKVKFGDKYGYIDTSGELVIDSLFTSASDFRDGFAIVTCEGRKGVIKRKDNNDKEAGGQIVSMLLEDENKNGKIEAEETFKVLVTIKNTGEEALKDAIITLTAKEDALEELTLKETLIKLDTIAPGEETTAVFTGKAIMEVNTQDVRLDVKFVADNLLFADLRNKSFEVVGVKNSKPLLSKYWVFKDNHSALKQTDQANLKVDVINDGKDIARDVMIKLFWPEGTQGVTDSLFISSIAPGETKSIQTTFIMDSTLTTNEFTIVASLTEYTKTKTDIKYLAFESEKMNVETVLYSPLYPTQSGNLFNPYLNHMAANPAAAPAVSKSELLDELEQVNELNPNRYALIIGNEKYDENKRTVSSEQNVDFARQDAEVFAAYAKSILGVPESNIILLKDATYAQMNFNINKICMISKTNPGNVDLVVYYAGHGQHDVNSKETFLIPVDVSISAPTQGIKLEGMYAQLSSCEAKRTTVFLDACYSGVGRGIVIQPKNTPVKGDMVVMTASSSTQRSMPYQEKKHGMFTYFLLKALKDTKGNVSMGALFNLVKQDVQKNSIWINNVEQTPELISGEGIDQNWKDWSAY